jgi:hypothetical protein
MFTRVLIGLVAVAFALPACVAGAGQPTDPEQVQLVAVERPAGWMQLVVVKRAFSPATDVNQIVEFTCKPESFGGCGVSLRTSRNVDDLLSEITTESRWLRAGEVFVRQVSPDRRIEVCTFADPEVRSCSSWTPMSRGPSA